MSVQKFDDELDVEAGQVIAAGPLLTEPGEKVLALCVKILQDDRLLAECDPHAHPFQIPSEGRWKMDADLIAGGPPPREGPALGVAVVVTSGPEPGQMATYQWIDPVKLRVPGRARGSTQRF